MYEKPVVIPAEDIAEGVYMASGTVNTAGDGERKCDSIYMKGVYQAPNYNLDGTSGYKAQFGCLGCPAFTYNACGLQTHYVESGEAGSYDVDNGNRKPSWESLGYLPDQQVTDWNLTGQS